jgi:large subunit ribosomal protein L10
MVSEKKKQELTQLKETLEKYPVIGIIDLFKMPSKQLQDIRKNLRKEVLIKMSKKGLINLALKDVKNKKNIEKLNELKINEPGIILTQTEPFKLFRILKQNKSLTYAKENDIAPHDLIIRAGATNLLAGPAIGELQRLKIPAMIKEGKIHVREDTTVVKKGETISLQLAGLLKKLDIQPIQVGINLLVVWEDGIVYGKEVLDVDEKSYAKKISDAYISALNLAVNVGYPTKDSIKLLIQKAFLEAKNLGVNAGIFDKDIINDLVMKANIKAHALKNRLKI